MQAREAYFGWILDRMAAFSPHGFRRLDELLAGLGLAVLALAVPVGVGALSRVRPRRRHH